MPGTYSQLLLHAVFSTKGRTPWITAVVAERLYPYIGGLVRAEKGALFDIGGIEDHVHLYLKWRPDGSVSELMRTVKARSSKWIHDTFPKLRAFAWQEGYSVFSVSKSQEDAVKKYIGNQAEHHKKEDFRSELLRILRLHGVEFEEKYVFDCRLRPIPLPLRGRVDRMNFSTGSVRRSGLHPWLQSFAPFGAKKVPNGSTTRTPSGRYFTLRALALVALSYDPATHPNAIVQAPAREVWHHTRRKTPLVPIAIVKRTSARDPRSIP